MATTRPCIVGQMGSTRFYETTMTAGELAKSVRPARETDGWATASIDERIQREVNTTRVRNTIVPYLANHPDRFFGSFIVLADQGMLNFEPLTKLVGDLPGAYMDSVESMGFLTIKGKGSLVALDGQHRLVAFREVITNPAELGAMAGSVGDDEVCVLFLEFESAVKTRRIFNKVNRNAKPTGKSDNVITSEDDGYAIVTRRLLDVDFDGPLAKRDTEDGPYEPVEWMSTTLPKSSNKFTTLSAVYETVKEVLMARGYSDFGERENPVAPPEKALSEAYELIADWYRTLLTLPVYAEALEHPSKIAGIRHSPTDPRSLLLRPVGQIALGKALVRAEEESKGADSLPVLLDRVAKISWSPSPNNIWRDVIVRADGRMIAKKDAYELAADLTCYLILPGLPEEQVTKLWQSWNTARGRDPFSPVDDLEDDQMPQDLPEQIL